VRPPDGFDAVFLQIFVKRLNKSFFHVRRRLRPGLQKVTASHG
jgi:hypothetical protein